MDSPFRVGGPVTGEFFTDRAEEVERIHEAMRTPTRLLVRGLRRQGKTSAIAQAGRRFRDEGGTLLWVDLSTAARLEDLRDRLVSSIPGGFFGRFEGLRKLAMVMEVRIDPASGAQTYVFRVERAKRADAGGPGVREQLRILLEAVGARAAEDRPVAVVIDEVQALHDLGEDRVDWLLRDLMQATPEVSFICAGSQPSIVHAMTEKDAAFYRFFTPGPSFGPIDRDHLATWIADRMKVAGVACPRDVAERILERAGERTQDVMLLAQETFRTGAASGEATLETVEESVSAIAAREADRFGTLWDGLTRNQRLVVRALASGVEDPFAHGSIPDVAPGSIQRALEGLGKRNVLMDVPSAYRLDDPFFAAWALRYAMPDSVPRELTEGGGGANGA